MPSLGSMRTKYQTVPVQGTRDRYHYDDATMRRAFPLRTMDSTHPIRDSILLVELLFVCHTAFFKRVPLLRLTYRSVTAVFQVLPPHDRVAAEFRINFRSPYFHIPVSVDRSQIGRIKRDQSLKPGAFRVFDWQTWAHIDGNVEWHGERHAISKGQKLELITGFSYRIPELPGGVGNLGLRLAEGVEGKVRIACGRTIAQVDFDPVFWLLEATIQGFRPVPIKTNKLMGLIVSLFEIGSGSPHVARIAATDLRQWVEHNVGSEKPFAGTRELLGYIRDCGPLGMEPLYEGIKDLIEQLQVADFERELFDFVADNWGVRSSRNGRMLAAKLLATLNTDRAKAALQALYRLVRNAGLAAEELDLILSVAKKAKGHGKNNHPILLVFWPGFGVAARVT